MIRKSYLLLIVLGVQFTLNAQLTNNDTEDATPINKPRVRLVVLNTTDVTLTQDHIERLRDIGEYIEDFYVSKLTAKGYVLTNTDMFARNTNGDILVYTANSTQPSTAISNIKSTATNLAQLAYPDLTNLNTVWAIAHFKDGGGFVGGGNIASGGMRFQLKDAVGSINFSSHIAQTNYHRGVSLKAIAHELGHALTVLHLGPQRANTQFNTLMGPISTSYENTVGIPQTADVQLSDYTAAIIAYHPIFRDSAFQSSELNNKSLKIEKIMGDYDLFTIDCFSGVAHVRGKVTSNLPFHHIVIRFTYDNLEGGGYWNSSFAVTPDANGVFDLQLSENDINIGPASRNSFEYEVMVAFDNGLSRGVSRLDTNEPIDINKNQYTSGYSFDTDTNITQNITLSGNTLSTDYGGAMSYQWIDCNNNYPITGANAQSYTSNSNGSHAVKIVLPNGCTHTSSCYNETDLLDIYPNPNNGTFFIKSKNDKIKNIELHNISGQRILQKDYWQGRNTVTIDLLSSGIYILRIRTDKKTYTMKIISLE